ncbi:MAG TPA: S8 family peptidase [Longimicrobiaceae bacterium]|nr:S8 family peptidase [Longimicrobiaceae bacterium]
MRKRSIGSRLLLGLALLAAGACSDDPTSPSRAPEEPTPSVVQGQDRTIPGQYVIVFKDEASDVRGLARAMAAAPKDSVLFIYEHTIKGFAARLAPASVEAVKQHPMVDRVTPDEYGIMDQSAGTWGLDRIDQRHLPLNGIYGPNRDGTGVNIYIIDSGIRKSHSEFGFGVRARHGYTVINDGRGSEDCNGHGTHVAGTAAGTTYGVAKNATVWAVRIGDCNGGATVSGVISAIDWVKAYRTLPAVANLSYSWSARTDIDDAVQRAIAAGVTFVTSAGNANANACNYSPNRKSNVLTVGATQSNDWRASYSNWGSCVKLFAPGSGITSSWYTGDYATNTIDGTSMSSPHVAGVAALYLQGDPSAAPWKVQDAVVSSATAGVVLDPKGSPNRLLYAFPVYFSVYVDGPSSISFTGDHTWEAFPSGGDGTYTYQWSVYYYQLGYTQNLGTGKTQTLYVYQGDGDFDIMVTATSAGQTKSSSMYVYNGGSGGGGPCDPFTICP